MNKKIFSLIILLGLSITIFSQEQIGSFVNTLKTSSYNIKIKNVFSIVDEKTEKIAFFFTDAKNVYAYKLNTDFTVEEKLSFVDKRRKYKTLIGHSISENGDYTIVLTNTKKNKFLSVHFSFKNKTTSSEETILVQGEKFIQAASKKNKFYLITTRRNFDNITIYSNQKDGKLKKDKLDLKHLSFISKQGEGMYIGDILTGGLYSTKDPINKIDENIPNSIEITAELKKMYEKDNTLIFTLDDNKHFTQILTLNLDDYSTSQKMFKKDMFDALRTNSFINGNNIFIASTNKSKFVLKVFNYTTQELIKEYTITKEEPITFKNTPIIQEGGAYGGVRKLEKAKKFLRKINTGKFGVSVRKTNKNNYHITIGAYVVKRQSGMMMGGFGAMSIGSVGNVSMFFNPTQFAFNSMSNTRSTRIECLFDENLNHVEGKIEDTVFDKMKNNKAVSSKEGEVIFKYKDYFIRSEYIHYSKMCVLKKFTN